jgi:predicted PurR-regulated permease PerM
LVIPQLISSLSGFIGKFDEYAASLIGFLGTLGVSTASLGSLESMTANALSAIQDFISKNAGSILGVAAGAGKGILTIGIALILSVYLMLSKKSVLAGVARLLRGLLKQKRYDGMVVFLKRCDDIFIHFVVYSLLESVIVGGVNFLFMLVMGMQYAGLISVVVGVCNLIPTFGPVIGGAIGAFILLLVNPIHALIFIAFTVGLQFVDGYILKPKIFGGSLGISGLLILVAVIVGGNMFGVLGMLLAIPAAAILDIVYKDYLLPFIEKDRG